MALDPNSVRQKVQENLVDNGVYLSKDVIQRSVENGLNTTATITQEKLVEHVTSALMDAHKTDLLDPDVYIDADPEDQIIVE